MISLLFRIFGVFATLIKFLPSGVFSLFTFEKHYHHHYGEKYEYRNGEVPE
jgi:hypothetical protein